LSIGSRLFINGLFLDGGALRADGAWRDWRPDDPGLARHCIDFIGRLG
jgi:hypothetical protein